MITWYGQPGIPRDANHWSQPAVGTASADFPLHASGWQYRVAMQYFYHIRPHQECHLYLWFQEASVFVFEKKLIERYSRRDKDMIVDSFKKAVSQLTRLRHPKILSVLHPLEESR